MKIDKYYNLSGYWNDDYINLKESNENYINELFLKSNSKYEIIDYRLLKNENLKKELKYFVYNKIKSYSTSLNILSPYLLRPIKLIISFLAEFNPSISSFVDIDECLTAHYYLYLEKNGITVKHTKKYNYKKHIARFIYNLKSYFYFLYEDKNGFASDFWLIDSLNISNDRINLSATIKSFDFSKLSNKNNKEKVKSFIKYLILRTSISVGYIKQKFYIVYNFVKFIDYITLENVDRNIVENYITKISSNSICNSTFNTIIYALKEFFDYGIIDNWRSKNELYFEEDLKFATWKLNKANVDSFIADQFLQIIDKIPFQLSCMFLVLYTCGMRVSEVCMLEIKNMFKDEFGCYLQFYQQKMKKEVSNPIPQVLYELLTKQKNNIYKDRSKKEKYFFSSDNNMPYKSSRFRVEMIKICDKFDIKNADGTSYKFKAHDFRHNYATRLVENDIPFLVIQKLLHHSSPEMTLIYAEISENKKNEKYNEFIDIVGDKSKYLFQNQINNDDIKKVQWMRANLNAQTLPNGFCALPVGLGSCPHANTCLTCDSFKTTIKHIPILKVQLDKTCDFIKLCKKNGWDNQYKSNLKIKNNLINILKKMECTNET